MDAGRLQEIEVLVRTLSELEEQARTVAVTRDWPLWDLTRAVVRGTNELLAEVETARVDPLRASLIGILRAEGYYVVSGPGCGDGSACPPQGMAVHAPTEPPRNANPFTFELDIGENLQIVGGPYDGWRACVMGYSGDQYLVMLRDRADEIACLPRIDYDRVFVKSGSPEKNPVDLEPTNSKSRKAEVPITAAEWSPTKAQMAGFLKDKDLRFDSEDEVTSAVDAFKSATMATSPDLRLARWSANFQAWHKARLASQ